MLPVFKNKLEGSASAPVEHVKRTPDQEEEYDALESAVSELIDACKKGDVKAGCVALRSAFQMLSDESTVGEDK